MKEVSSRGVRTLEDDEIDVIFDPPGQIGYTQSLFLAMSPQSIPIHRGVFRFKTHEEMNAHWDDAMQKLIKDRQSMIHAPGDENE